jgi:phosphoribosylformylglycinamidine cyclo-ligase
MKYADAGVDVYAEERAVKELLKVIRPSLLLRKDMISEAGKFSGWLKIGNRYVATSTDGAGTKTLIAEKLEKYDTIGIDLIAMVANDLICDGFEPVALSDYIVVREPDEKFMRELGKGLLQGAKKANTAIISGETAVHANMNQKFDLGATALGVTETVLQPTAKEGDTLIGLHSSGVHCNGISLIRTLFEDDENILRETLTPTRIYVKEILNLIGAVNVTGLVNITGSAFLKLKRIASGATINLPEIPPIFHKIMERGVAFEEMCRTYNMGIGFVVAVDKSDEEKALELLDGTVIGELTKKHIRINGYQIDR